MILYKKHFIDIQTKNEIDFKIDKTEIQKDIEKSIFPTTEGTTTNLIYFVTQYQKNCEEILQNQEVWLHAGEVYCAFDPQKQEPFFAQEEEFQYYYKGGEKKESDFKRKEMNEIFSDANKKFDIPEGMEVLFLSPISFNCLKKVKIWKKVDESLKMVELEANKGLKELKGNQAPEVDNQQEICNQAFKELSKDLISRLYKKQLIQMQKERNSPAAQGGFNFLSFHHFCLKRLKTTKSIQFPSTSILLWFNKANQEQESIHKHFQVLFTLFFLLSFSHFILKTQIILSFSNSNNN